jgi:hypothetical protein
MVGRNFADLLCRHPIRKALVSSEVQEMVMKPDVEVVCSIGSARDRNRTEWDLQEAYNWVEEHRQERKQFFLQGVERQ